MVMTGFTIAWIMTALPVTVLLAKFLLYQAHKSLGLCVFGLVALRLGLTCGVGERPRDLPAALYGLLLLVPVLGYFTAAAAPGGVPTLFLLILPVPHAIAPDVSVFGAIRPAHRWLAIGLICLAAWHAGKIVLERKCRGG